MPSIGLDPLRDPLIALFIALTYASPEIDLTTQEHWVLSFWAFIINWVDLIACRWGHCQSSQLRPDHGSGKLLCLLVHWLHTANTEGSTDKTAQAKQHIKACMLVDIATTINTMLSAEFKGRDSRWSVLHKAFNFLISPCLQFLDAEFGQRYNWCLQFRALPCDISRSVPTMGWPWCLLISTTDALPHREWWNVLSFILIYMYIIRLIISKIFSNMRPMSNIHSATLRARQSASVSRAMIIISIIFELWLKILVKSRVLSWKLSHILLFSCF